jgi:hypothetical protein
MARSVDGVIACLLLHALKFKFPAGSRLQISGCLAGIFQKIVRDFLKKCVYVYQSPQAGHADESSSPRLQRRTHVIIIVDSSVTPVAVSYFLLVRTFASYRV